MKKIVLAVVVGLFLVGCARPPHQPANNGGGCGCEHHEQMHGNMQNGSHAHDHQMMHKH